MQLRVRHTTGYRYPEGAIASFNEARMTPMTTADQVVLRSRIEVTPTPWTTEYRDYWGSVVTAFEVHEPHDELLVVANSTVQTSGARVVEQLVPWEALDAVRDRYVEFLTISRWVAPPDDLLAELQPAREHAATPSAYAHAVCDFVNDRLSYVEGATQVTSAGAEAWGARSGVCQDFAHITLGVLRTAGIPARYVSGYLHPNQDAVIGEEVAGESHAWIEWWDGAWIGFDPTNDRAAGAHHVVVARGRDYDDVPPLRGIYSTRGDSELFVNVTVTRLA
ncbi:MAG TPA: transglutaminase family protein [Aeromicrobium sp.]|nr:transglutaminase family protein [Aeromicrobium sp.]HKY58041.1 transglutaminase family protein [Aeromicrobium sp.]